ncbi:MAG TPA: Na+/H+ antiporter [Chryseolinea sp.]
MEDSAGQDEALTEDPCGKILPEDLSSSMQNDILLILSLLFGTLMLVMLGQRLRISYPIFLVIAGLGLSFVPGIPHISVDPELIFLIFLPPLLYEAAWFTSWSAFWKWRRVIAMLAFGLVFVTATAVAYVSSALIPGFTLAMGFLLGGIISPPDALAATSVLRNIKVPKRLTAILEGESLVNDASSLIVFRFALAAIVSGQFVLQDVIVQFFLAAGMGVIVGLAIAHVVYMIHRFLPTSSSIDVTLTLMTPYFMYMGAEQFHFSGVMAVVSGGLFLSYRSHEILSNGATRMQANGVWSTTTFVLNALVFILIGLELPVVIEGLESYSRGDLVMYALVISAVAIVVRLLWVFPLAYVPIWFKNRVRADNVNPTWKGPLIIGWAGMRGVVSLASALSVPLLLNEQTPFPHRNLILFLTFVVILVTLVFQGLTLPWLIRWVKILESDKELPEGQQEAGIQIRLKKVALSLLQEKFAHDISENELVGLLKNNLESDVSEAQQRLDSLECDTMAQEEIDRYHEVLQALYAQQRKELFMLRKEKAFSDEVIRKQELQLDLDETKISNHTH